MFKDVVIERPEMKDIESVHHVFEKTIADAFFQEGLEELKDVIQNEISHKKDMLDQSFNHSESGILFLVAKIGEEVVGTISFGPSGGEIRDCTGDELMHMGELGSLMILPEYQNRGIGSSLINALMVFLEKEGIKSFCLDSGYKRAQKRWLRKFGTPYKIAKDYWGEDGDHMIWVCSVSDHLR